MKRVLDVTICLAVLPLALPVMAVIALAILIDSGWPIFFFQERVGKDGKRFRLYKFRTLIHGYDDPAAREYMRAFVRGQVGNEKPGREWVHKPVEKRHMSGVGRLLRKSSLDELPQIFNVLRGEMSLIGPRPNVPWEVEAYLDWHYERLRGLPGITGLAQVRGRSCISFDQIASSDVEYIERQCLLLDLQILWWTLTSILGGRGAG
jgi:lipopolysaccharide/colanic/teichoic acid biosynthesis glycosyltransferase